MFPNPTPKLTRSNLTQSPECKDVVAVLPDEKNFAGEKKLLTTI
jgi:hypothetical protein